MNDTSTYAMEFSSEWRNTATRIKELATNNNINLSKIEIVKREDEQPCRKLKLRS